LTETYLTQSQEDIARTCNEILEMLLEKNRKYGDSALNPVRIFSKCDTQTQINVRLDDKLSRLKNAQTDEDEDVIADLIGYLILLQVAKMQQRRVDNFVIT
jgi:CRISPR/Cas system CSM-associated protein Csm2 small subunit